MRNKFSRGAKEHSGKTNYMPQRASRRVRQEKGRFLKWGP